MQLHGPLKLFTMIIFARLCLTLAGSSPAAAALLVNEIMYNPVAGPDNTDGDEYEFLELYNPGPEAVDLSGASFTRGITYTFPDSTILDARAYLLLVRNRAAFLERYPDAGPLAPDVYAGRLDNTGEQITLADAGGSELADFEYRDTFDWPQWADGHGSSLSRRDAGSDPDEPETWCDSSAVGGTPGAENTCADVSIVINEVLTHSDPPCEDAIELYNAGTAAIDLDGWYLSDDARTLQKFRIIDIVLDPGEYTVFYEYQFSDNASGTTAFALNSVSGDEIFLSAPDPSGEAVHLVDVVALDSGQRNVSCGRFPNGSGPLVPMQALTFGADEAPDQAAFRTGAGAPNADPALGPVIISEIMYHPADDDPELEYIELSNLSRFDVALYDTELPWNTWKLTSAVRFAFPPGTTIPAGGCILVTGAEDIETFRAACGVRGGVEIYGPWDGQLSNCAETIKLKRPDTPTDNGTVPWILVDRADYRDCAPWPAAADGDGPALERTSPGACGTSAGSWEAGPVGGSPGSANYSADHCFIATAAFGSPIEKHVVLLKQFRDTRLFPHPAGRAFVRGYYRWSPPLARTVAGHPALRLVVRIALVPLLLLAWSALNPVPAAIALLLGVGMIGMLAAIRRRQH